MQAYIFDLDGTLLDTLDDLTASVNYALEVCGLPFRTREEVRGFVGNGIKKLIERAVGAHGDCIEPALKAFKEHYEKHCTDFTKPYAGVREMLAALKKAGKKLAIVSNKADFAVKKLAKIFFPEIDVAIGEDEAAGVRKKPAPDSVFEALKQLGAEKENAVYIGDSEVDIQTALAVGLPCISVTWGFKDADFLQRNGAMRLVGDPRELLAE